MNELITGSHGAYRWAASATQNMNALLRECPEIVIGKYVAITSYDSGTLQLTERDRLSGWRSEGGIAYGPSDIRTLADLPDCARFEPAELYQEWYVFTEPAKLGATYQGNVFTSPPSPGRFMAFVNHVRGDIVHDSQFRDLANLFWEQVDRVKPESYMAEGEDYTTFLTSNQALFGRALEILGKQ
jgi:hypothetical protein